MSDITAQPYAEWLESTLRELVELQPRSIGIICVMPDDQTGTAYYNSIQHDRTKMIEAIQQDSLLDFIRVNAETIARIIEGEDDEA